jgi:hypothetical protein
MSISFDQGLTGLTIDFEHKAEVSSEKDKPVKSAKRVRFQEFKKWALGEKPTENSSKKYPKEKVCAWASHQAYAKYEIGDIVPVEEVFGPAVVKSSRVFLAEEKS